MNVLRTRIVRLVLLGSMFALGCSPGAAPFDDAGTLDAGSGDAGTNDAGPMDAGDAGPDDAGQSDAGLPMGPEATRIAAMRALMAVPDGGRWLLREGLHTYLFSPAGQGRTARHDLLTVTGRGSDGPFGDGGVAMLRGVDEVTPVGAALAPTSSSGWAAAASGDRTWLATSTLGESLQFMVPADVAVMNLEVIQHVNGGGVASVTVDGDNASQTAFPTATELVAANRLAAAQLSSQGGTIPDGQRVSSSYLPSTGTRRVVYPLVFSGVRPHVVVVTHVGHRAGATTSATQRSSVKAVLTWKPTDTAALNPMEPMLSSPLASTPSAWEVATAFTPPGRGPSFMGTYHGNETQTALRFELDGSPVVPADGVAVPVERALVITRESFLSHPEVGRVARVSTRYTLDGDGLRFAPNVEWETPGVVTAAYAMLPVNGPLEPGGFDRAMTSAYAGPPAVIPRTVPLDADHAAARSASAWVWNDERIAQLTVLTPAWFDGWRHTDRETVVEGRALAGAASTTSLTKVYAARVKRSDGSGEAVAAGTVHAYEALVRFRWVGDTSAVLDPATGSAR